MRISDIHNNCKQPISFEIFPPKGELEADKFTSILDSLKKLNPAYISVTYSAGGSGDTNKTIDLSGIIQNDYNITSIAHQTCINSTKQEILQNISKMKQQGIENVLALRGDIIEGKATVDFKYAYELISIMKDNGFCVGAACYPEGHVECEDLDVDIERMKIKQDAGADFFLSQLFFDNRYFFDFLESAAKNGITKPIAAGVMPLLGKSQVSRMIFMCGASLPSAIIKILNKYTLPDDIKKAGIEYAAKQIRELLSNNVDGIHIYTMNQPEIAENIIKLL